MPASSARSAHLWYVAAEEARPRALAGRQSPELGRRGGAPVQPHLLQLVLQPLHRLQRGGEGAETLRASVSRGGRTPRLGLAAAGGRARCTALMCGGKAITFFLAKHFCRAARGPAQSRTIFMHTAPRCRTLCLTGP